MYMYNVAVSGFNPWTASLSVWVFIADLACFSRLNTAVGGHRLYIHAVTH